MPEVKNSEVKETRNFYVIKSKPYSENGSRSAVAHCVVPNNNTQIEDR